MKMYVRNRHSHCSEVQQHPRAGSVFEYYFAYMLLTSLILSTAGFCIHLLMKAFDEQNNTSRFVQSALSSSRQLRSDDLAAESRQIIDGRLEMRVKRNSSSAGVQSTENPAGTDDIVWQTEKCVLIRRATTEAGSSENRFVFPLGTTFRIFVDQQQRCVVLVRDPLPPNVDLGEEDVDDATPGEAQPKLIDGLLEPHSFEIVLGAVK